MSKRRFQPQEARLSAISHKVRAPCAQGAARAVACVTRAQHTAKPPCQYMRVDRLYVVL